VSLSFLEVRYAVVPENQQGHCKGIYIYKSIEFKVEFQVLKILPCVLKFEIATSQIWNFWKIGNHIHMIFNFLQLRLRDLKESTSVMLESALHKWKGEYLIFVSYGNKILLAGMI
jgi:hypothetical protein